MSLPPGTSFVQRAGGGIVEVQRERLVFEYSVKVGKDGIMDEYVSNGLIWDISCFYTFFFLSLS